MANQRLVEGDERQKQHGCLHFLDLAERGAGFKMRLAIEASANLQCRQRSKQGGDVEQRHRRPDTVILNDIPAVPPQITGLAHQDRKSVVEGKSWTVRVENGGDAYITK